MVLARQVILLHGTGLKYLTGRETAGPREAPEVVSYPSVLNCDKRSSPALVSTFIARTDGRINMPAIPDNDLKETG